MQQFFSPFDIITARDWISLNAAVFWGSMKFPYQKICFYYRLESGPKKTSSKWIVLFIDQATQFVQHKALHFKICLIFLCSWVNLWNQNLHMYGNSKKNWNGYVLDSNQLGKDSPNWRNCLTTSWLRKKKLCCQKNLCGQNLRKYSRKKIVVTRRCQGYLYVIKRGLHLKL